MTNPKSERFPRGDELPSQSPLFWVEQKDRYLRQILIRDIEALTKRRLIVYFANRFANAQIDHGDLLTKGMLQGRTDAEIEGIVQKISSRDSYFSHGSVIDHREAASLGLSVNYLPPGEPVWERLWLLHCMYEHDCKRGGFLKVFEGRALSTAVAIPLAPSAPPRAP
jgi:hypothetical protein